MVKKQNKKLPLIYFVSGFIYMALVLFLFGLSTAIKVRWGFVAVLFGLVYGGIALLLFKYLKKGTAIVIFLTLPILGVGIILLLAVIALGSVF